MANDAIIPQVIKEIKKDILLIVLIILKASPLVISRN